MGFNMASWTERQRGAKLAPDASTKADEKIANEATLGWPNY